VRELIQIQNELIRDLDEISFSDFLIRLNEAVKGYITDELLALIELCEYTNIFNTKTVKRKIRQLLRRNFAQIQRVYVEKGLLQKTAVLTTPDTTLNKPMSIFDKLEL